MIWILFIGFGFACFAAGRLMPVEKKLLPAHQNDRCAVLKNYPYKTTIREGYDWVDKNYQAILRCEFDKNHAGPHLGHIEGYKKWDIWWND